VGGGQNIEGLTRPTKSAQLWRKVTNVGILSLTVAVPPCVLHDGGQHLASLLDSRRSGWGGDPIASVRRQRAKYILGLEEHSVLAKMLNQELAGVREMEESVLALLCNLHRWRSL
jgi:hypothetical protein